MVTSENGSAVVEHGALDEGDEEDDDDDDNIDVGLMDNVKTAGGALALLCLFLRIQSKS